jgi:hypothetical protein
MAKRKKRVHWTHTHWTQTPEGKAKLAARKAQKRADEPVKVPLPNQTHLYVAVMEYGHTVAWKRIALTAETVEWFLQQKG